MKMTCKRLLATALIVIIVMGVIPVVGIDFGSIFAAKASAMDLSSYNVGDTITFGSYPQSKVTDSATISALDAMSKTWISYGYYSGTGSSTDGNMKPSDYMKYCDISFNGNKYRAVTFSQYRPYLTGYTSSKFNSRQDKNGYDTDNVYYFKYEPLTWRVLDPSEGFVMCNTAIDAQAYNNYIIRYDNGNGTSEDDCYGNSEKTYYASDWTNSSIRAWLNNDFYNTAFTSSEKSQIGITYNENKSTYSSQYDSADTSDKIFLLSYNEVLNSKYGFSSSYSTYDTARQLKSTDYAKCQGCYQYTGSTMSCLGNSWWRLRSPYFSSNNSYVDNDGYLCYSHGVYYTYDGIVPAFKFNPQSTITYNANGGSVSPSSATVDFGKSVTLPTPTRSGYTCLGWSTNSSATTASYSCGANYSPDSDVTLYAVWELMKVKSVSINDIEVKYKSSANIKPVIEADSGVKYTVKYESSNPSVATVDKDGNITTFGKGETKITCTVTDEYGNVAKDSCNVNVYFSFGQWLIWILLFGFLWY